MSETPDRIESIFAAAVAKATAEDRAAYLDQACSGDADLRGQVEALLRAHDRAGHLLDRPVPGGSEQTRSYTPNEQPGAIIAGRYKLLEAIGEGGMGTVWVAEQSQPVKRKVALKLIKAGMDSKSVVARFEAERQALAVMDHPNIAKVLDGGLTETGRPYFVMEYVKGVPITEYCDATRMSIPERLNLFVQVCSAVQHAHQKGIIHRDLKPSNILVAPYDDKAVPKVIDFGLAKAMHQSLTERTLHTAHETVLGTPLYMSPEQAQLNNLDVDTRSDIYSLGVLLYELLTGTTPLEKRRFKEAAWDEIKRLIREEEPPRPSTRLSSANTLASLAAGRQLEPAKLTKLVRGELDWIVMKSLEKDRTRRYETANGFALDIQRYLAGEPVQAAPPSTRYRLSKFAWKHRTSLTIAAAFALLLLAGVAISTWQAVRATHAEDAARAAEQDALLAQRAEAERAEGERLAKLDAEAKRSDAEKALARAEVGEKLAAERLVQVEAEKKKAEEEKQAADAVKAFLHHKLLAQADTAYQADTLLRSGKSPSVTKVNPTIRELLDRAAIELAPNAIKVNFPKQPLSQAEILRTVGDTYLGIGEFETGIELLKRSATLYQQHLGSDDGRTLDCVDKLAQAYQVAGKLDLALPLFEQTLMLKKTKLGAEHPDTVRSVHNLAAAFHASGKWDLAVPLYERALERTKANLGTDHPDTLNSLNNLALLYFDAGKLVLALPLLEESLKLTKAKLGAEHPSTLTSMNNLATAYRAAGKLDLALPLLEQTLAIKKAKLGPEHPSTLLSMNNLAAEYQSAGKLDRAIPLYERTLELTKAKLGPEHPSTLSSMLNLATAYREARKVDLALPLFEQSLKLMKAQLGADHPDTLKGSMNLAGAYRIAGKLDLALPLHEETLKLMKVKLGGDHPDTLLSMNNLAIAYQVAGKLDLALPLFEQALMLTRAKLGPEHPDTVVGMMNLAKAYKDAGKMELALPLVEESVRFLKTKLGPEHPDALNSILTLGNAYSAVNQGEKAAATFSEFISGQRKRLKSNSQLAELMAQVAWELMKCNQHAAAEEFLREGLSLREKTQPNHWTTFNTKSLLGGALLGQKRYLDAEPLLLAGYEGMKQREKSIPPQWRIRIPEAAERLVQLYEATDKMDEAAKWRKILESHAGKVVGPVHDVGEGLELRGQLDKQTPTLVYPVKLAAGKTYVIDMVSSDQKALDPLLVLTDAAGKKLAEDDDSGGGLNARITFRADQAGTYRIQATTFNAGVGPFTLTVHEKGNPPNNERQ